MRYEVVVSKKVGEKKKIRLMTKKKRTMLKKLIKSVCG
jgi:hypothetical protein